MRYNEYQELGNNPETIKHSGKIMLELKLKWQTKVKELTYEEFDKINEFMCKQHEDKNSFFKQITGE